jgi:hypothetical protein
LSRHFLQCLAFPSIVSGVQETIEIWWVMELLLVGTKIYSFFLETFVNKVEKILKGSLDSIPSPSPLVEIQIMGKQFA